MKKRYRKLSDYLKERYGTRVMRIPLNAGFGCPNRVPPSKGCIYCDPTGSGFGALPSTVPIPEQIKTFKERFAMRGISKFIAYFQAHTNTFASPEVLWERYSQVLGDDSIVAVSIATRPDCLSEEVLDVVARLREHLDVFLEIGLQTVNYKTLEIINRGHGLAEFVDASIRAKRRGLELVAHVIINLPWDDMEDVVETAKVLSALEYDGVKLHSLYIVEGTKLGDMYNSGLVRMCSMEEYVERVVTFLEYLDPRMVIHRLVSDPPKNGVIFGNWGVPKIVIINAIEKKLEERDTYQGRLFGYLRR